MTKNKSKVLLGFIIIQIFALGFFAYPWADDFCVLIRTAKMSAWDYALFRYNNWDGRFITFFMQGLLLKNYTLGKWSVLLWVACYFGAIWGLYKIVFRDLISSSQKNVKILLFSFLAIVCWIGFRRHIAETVYWSTGGGYIFASLIGLWWMYAYPAFLNTRSRLFLVSYCVFTIIAGMNSFSLSPALVTYILFPILVSKIKKKEVEENQSAFSLRTATALALLILSTLTIVLAPGNFIRSQHSADSFKGNILVNLVDVNIKFIAFGWPLVILILLLAFFIIYLVKSGQIQLKNKSFLYLGTKWFLVAAATASPLAALNAFTSPRTAIFFHFFFILSLLCFYIVAGLKIKKFALLRHSFIICFIGFQALILSDLYYGHQLSEEIKARHAHLKSLETNKTVAIEPIKSKIPKSLKFSDLSKDKKHWINGCFAAFYNLRGGAVIESSEN